MSVRGEEGAKEAFKKPACGEDGAVMGLDGVLETVSAIGEAGGLG